MSVTQLGAVDITVTKAQSKASRSFYLLVHASQCEMQDLFKGSLPCQGPPIWAGNVV